MSYRVETRTVKRHYASRIATSGHVAYKPYGSKRAAYKAIAKEILLDLVFGPKEEQCGNPGTQYECYWWERPGITALQQAEDFKKGFGAAMQAFGFQCDVNGYYDGEPCSCCPDDYTFCAMKYKAWLDAKATELMRQELAPPSTAVPTTTKEHSSTELATQQEETK